MSPVFYPSPIISRVSVPSISPLLSFHSSLIYLLLFYLPHTAFFLSFFLSSVLLFSSSILFSFSLFLYFKSFQYTLLSICVCVSLTVNHLMPKWLNLRPPSVIEGTPRAFSIRKSSTPVQSRVNYSGREDKTSHTHNTKKKNTPGQQRRNTNGCLHVVFT